MSELPQPSGSSTVGHASLRLGLVGHGIGRSMSPRLHEILGELTGRTVEYPVFDHDESFTPKLGEFFLACRSEGRSGLNVTHPFKEAVCEWIEPDPLVEAMGACNTVRFDVDGTMRGHNTDCSGLQQALRPFVSVAQLSRVAVIGTGGFGRAAAFALDALGARELCLFDPVVSRASDLARRLQRHTKLSVHVSRSVQEACESSVGVVNCSPIGMHHHPGNPVEVGDLVSASWVFDAVYIPMKTRFLEMAEAEGATAISGSELFFWQAIDAFQHFTETSLKPGVIAAARRRVWPEVERRAAGGE